ncbi:hypothetical protein RFI_26288 [Reticulomyxa filosa]|uniref:Uncharacterized protein n=1 Tax=Reticulomyxa filosa TaxID=46433 RepID=X6MAP8_RETFI|nr:hypothetical protein RFI_26288 [Reticulomyxa filosa]|eukprot:ETO11088.1 hypothetical protein RFI_26288 [Reticulomyxa filosa]
MDESISDSAQNEKKKNSNRWKSFAVVSGAVTIIGLSVGLYYYLAKDKKDDEDSANDGFNDQQFHTNKNLLTVEQFGPILDTTKIHRIFNVLFVKTILYLFKKNGILCDINHLILNCYDKKKNNENISPIVYINIRTKKEMYIKSDGHLLHHFQEET